MAFLYSQMCYTPVYPSQSYTGKTVIITGSNTGLGKEAARHIVRLGASRMVLAVRNLDKGDAAKKDIQETTKCGKDVIEVWKLDMADYQSVQDFATRASQLARIDGVVLNAGVAPAKYRTAEGSEETITINVISTFLLAGLLLPKLRETAKRFHVSPTLTITSSSVSTMAKFPQRTAPCIFDALSDKDIAEANWDDQYPISKLIEVFCVRSIAAKDPSGIVSVNCVDPGLCHSDLSRDFDGWGFYFVKLVLARSTEKGSRTLVDAVSKGSESHGKYISDCKIAEPAKLVRGEEGNQLQGRIWSELGVKLNAISPSIMDNF